MAFINEYVSEQDIQKYDLNGIWDQYHPAWKGDYFIGQRPSWTIDKEKNIFLMHISRVAREAEDAREQKKLLWWDGCHVIAIIKTADGSSIKTTDIPFKKVWELVSLTIPKDLKVPDEEVIRVFKEALNAYGYAGIQRQIPNTVFEFKF